MKVTIEGTIRCFGEERQHSTGNYGSVVIDTFGEYSKPIKVDLKDDQIIESRHYGVGAPIKIDAYVNGREYNGNYYLSLKAHTLGAVSNQVSSGSHQSGAGSNHTTPPQAPAPVSPIEVPAAIGTVRDGKIFTQEHGWIQDTPEWRAYLESKGHKITIEQQQNLPF